MLPIKFELGPLQGVLKFFLLYSAFGAGSLTQQLVTGFSTIFFRQYLSIRLHFYPSRLPIHVAVTFYSLIFSVEYLII